MVVEPQQQPMQQPMQQQQRQQPRRQQQQQQRERRQQQRERRQQQRRCNTYVASEGSMRTQVFTVFINTAFPSCQTKFIYFARGKTSIAALFLNPFSESPYSHPPRASKDAQTVASVIPGRTRGQTGAGCRRGGNDMTIARAS